MIFIQLTGYITKCICQSIFQAITSTCSKEDGYSYSHNKDEQQSIFRNTLRFFIEITVLHVLNDFKHKYSSLMIEIPDDLYM